MKILDREIDANKRTRYDEPMMYGELWLHKKREGIVWVIFNILLVTNIISIFRMHFVSRFYWLVRELTPKFIGTHCRATYIHACIIIVVCCYSCLCCGVRYDNGPITGLADREILEIARHSGNPKTLSVFQRIPVPRRPIVPRARFRLHFDAIMYLSAQ